MPSVTGYKSQPIPGAGLFEWNNLVSAERIDNGLRADSPLTGPGSSDRCREIEFSGWLDSGGSPAFTIIPIDAQFTSIDVIVRRFQVGFGSAFDYRCWIVQSGQRSDDHAAGALLPTVEGDLAFSVDRDELVSYGLTMANVRDTVNTLGVAWWCELGFGPDTVYVSGASLTVHYADAIGETAYFTFAPQGQTHVQKVPTAVFEFVAQSPPNYAPTAVFEFVATEPGDLPQKATTAVFFFVAVESLDDGVRKAETAAFVFAPQWAVEGIEAIELTTSIGNLFVQVVAPQFGDPSVGVPFLALVEGIALTTSVGSSDAIVSPLTLTTSVGTFAGVHEPLATTIGVSVTEGIDHKVDLPATSVGISPTLPNPAIVATTSVGALRGFDFVQTTSAAGTPFEAIQPVEAIERATGVGTGVILVQSIEAIETPAAIGTPFEAIQPVEAIERATGVGTGVILVQSIEAVATTAGGGVPYSEHIATTSAVSVVPGVVQLAGDPIETPAAIGTPFEAIQPVEAIERATGVGTGVILVQSIEAVATTAGGGVPYSEHIATTSAVSVVPGVVQLADDAIEATVGVAAGETVEQFVELVATTVGVAVVPGVVQLVEPIAATDGVGVPGYIHDMIATGVGVGVDLVQV